MQLLANLAIAHSSSHLQEATEKLDWLLSDTQQNSDDARDS
jgi:hypothetical protein